jgi:hypothetical protein
MAQHNVGMGSWKKMRTAIAVAHLAVNLSKTPAATPRLVDLSKKLSATRCTMTAAQINVSLHQEAWFAGEVRELATPRSYAMETQPRAHSMSYDQTGKSVRSIVLQIWHALQGYAHLETCNASNGSPPITIP